MGQAQISQVCCDSSSTVAVKMQKVPVLEWSATEDTGDIVRRMSSAGVLDGKMSEELVSPDSKWEDFRFVNTPLQPHWGEVCDDALNEEHDGGALCEAVHGTPGYERFKDKSLTQWYDDCSVTTLGDHDSSSNHSNHSNSDDHRGSHNDTASARTEVFFLYDISRAVSGLSC